MRELLERQQQVEAAEAAANQELQRLLEEEIPALQKENQEVRELQESTKDAVEVVRTQQLELVKAYSQAAREGHIPSKQNLGNTLKLEEAQRHLHKAMRGDH